MRFTQNDISFVKNDGKTLFEPKFNQVITTLEPLSAETIHKAVTGTPIPFGARIVLALGDDRSFTCRTLDDFALNKTLLLTAAELSCMKRAFLSEFTKTYLKKPRELMSELALDEELERINAYLVYDYTM